MNVRSGILLVLISVGALAWQSAEGVRIPDNPLQLGQPGDPQEGERVFGGSGGCGSCHVIGGGGRRSGTM